MSTFPNSPRLLKGGIVLLGVAAGAAIESLSANVVT